VPAVAAKTTPPIGVAALPAGRDYLFIRENDPAIYRAPNGSALKAGVTAKNDGPVHVLAVTPDGTRVLAAGDNGEAKVWPVGSGTAPPTPVSLVGHTGTVRAAAISPDGKRAVTVAADDKLCEWELDTGKRLKRVDLPNVGAVTFLKDGQTLLLGTEDRSAELWSLDRQVRVRPLAGHRGPVTAVCVSPSWDYLFTGGDDGVTRTWSAVGAEVRSLPGNGTRITGLAVSPDGQTLVTSGPTAGRRFYAVRTGQQHGGDGGPTGPRALAFLADGRSVVGAGNSNLIVFRAPTVEVPAVPPPTELPDPFGLTLVKEIDLGSPAKGVGYRADGKYLWVLRAERIAVVDAQTGAEVKAWPAPPGSYPVDFGPNKELLVIANGKLQTWDWEKGTMVREYSLRDEPQRTSIIQVLPTHLPSRRLLTTTGPALIHYDVVRGEELDRLTPYPDERMHIAAPFPGNRRIVGDSHGLRGKSRFVVWDQTTKKEVLALADVPDLKHLHRVEVSPDGKWVLALARDAQGGQIATWDARTGKLVRVVPVPTKADGYSGGFTPAGDTYLFVEPGGRRTALHVPTGKLTEAGDEVKASTAVDSVPALGLFASADADGKLRLYRFADAPKTGPKIEPKVEVKAEPKTPKADTPVAVGPAKHSADLPDAVAGCVVSPDGKKVYVCTRKGTLHLLDVATGAEPGKPVEFAKSGVSHMATGARSAKLYVLDNDRQLHTFEGLTKFKAVDLGKDAGLPAVTASARMLVSPGDVYLMIFEPDSARLTTGFSRLTSKWAVPAIPPVLDRPNFNRYTNAVGYSPDGSVGAAAASGFDQELLVWQQTPFREYPLITPTGDTRWVAVSSEAKVVVSAGSSRIEAWKYENRAPVIARVAPHDGTAFVGAVAGVGLVTAGEDKTLKLWDLRTGKEAGQWSLPEPPAGVAVTPDGKTAVVWYSGGRKVGLWPLPDLKAKKP
ncbi:MAG TPA: WD40 repeat domain-containing protein, partial [Gemmataceae bacterium]|nr:WD40 repeat domain-containing protein [Gemmataceae bacterium]